MAASTWFVLSEKNRKWILQHTKWNEEVKLRFECIVHIKQVNPLQSAVRGRSQLTVPLWEASLYIHKKLVYTSTPSTDVDAWQTDMQLNQFVQNFFASKDVVNVTSADVLRSYREQTASLRGELDANRKNLAIQLENERRVQAGLLKNLEDREALHRQETNTLKAQLAKLTSEKATLDVTLHKKEDELQKVSLQNDQSKQDVMRLERTLSNEAKERLEEKQKMTEDSRREIASRTEEFERRLWMQNNELSKLSSELVSQRQKISTLATENTVLESKLRQQTSKATPDMSLQKKLSEDLDKKQRALKEENLAVYNLKEEIQKYRVANLYLSQQNKQLAHTTEVGKSDFNRSYERARLKYLLDKAEENRESAFKTLSENEKETYLSAMNGAKSILRDINSPESAYLSSRDSLLVITKPK